MMVHLTLCSPHTPGRGFTCLSAPVRLSGHIGVHDALRLDLKDGRYVAQVTDVAISANASMVIALAEPLITADVVQQMLKSGWEHSSHVESESGELVGVLLPYPVDEIAPVTHWLAFEDEDWDALRNPGILESLPAVEPLNEPEDSIDGVPSLATWRRRKMAQEATLC